MVDGSVADFATSNDHLSFLRSCGNGQAAGDPEHVDLMATKSWWPVDSDFWMRFFALGCRCKKVIGGRLGTASWPSSSSAGRLPPGASAPLPVAPIPGAVYKNPLKMLPGAAAGLQGQALCIGRGVRVFLF